MNQRTSNGRGGARKGAGRPLGSATRKTREIADKAAASGLTPLEVLLQTMTSLVERAEELKKNGPVAADEVLRLMVGAANVAKDAAPYIHPRLTSVEYKAQPSFAELTDAQIDANIEALVAKMGYTKGAPPLLGG